MREIEKQLIEAGINPTSKSVQNQLRRAREIARQRRAEDEKDRVKQSGRWATLARSLIINALSFVVMIFTAILVVGGMTVGVVAFLAAEFEAVRKGFTILDPELAGLYAAGILLMYLPLLFIAEVMTHQGETVSGVSRFSFRLWFRKFLYVFGIGRDWEAEPVALPSGLAQIRIALRLIALTIITFGVAGRFVELLAQHEGTAGEQLYFLVNQTSLLEILSVIGAFVMTVALLSGTHFIVYFIHATFVSFFGGISHLVNFSEAVDYEEEEETKALQAILQRAYSKSKTNSSEHSSP